MKFIEFVCSSLNKLKLNEIIYGDMSNSGTLELITNMSSSATEVLKSAAYGAINGTAAGINVGISSGLIDATKSLGSLAGTSILPGAGSIMGSAVGFTIGSALSSGTGALVGALFAAKHSISTELTKNHKNDESKCNS